MAKKKFLFSWSKFFKANLISATIAEANKDKIVLVFKTIKPFHAAIAGEFTSTGTGAARTCSNYAAVVSTGTITLTMNAAYVKSEGVTLAFNPTKKGATVSQTVTNNITS